MSSFGSGCREQQAELRRHIHVLTEMAARAEQGRGAAARLAAAAVRLGDLSHSVEREVVGLLSPAAGAATVVHISAGSGVRIESEPAQPEEHEVQASEVQTSKGVRPVP